MIWIAIAAAGAAGAVARYLLDVLLTTRLAGAWPRATPLINVTGSLLAGATAALVTDAVMPAQVGVVVAGGFLGAYTTFSTAMLESLRVFDEQTPVRGAVHLVAPMVASVAAALCGWALVGRLVG